jgi:tetratricopeptide (TPR) repeat protein
VSARVDWARYYELLELDRVGQPEAALAGLRELLHCAENSDEKSVVLLATVGRLTKLGRAKEAREALASAYRIVNKNSEIVARVLFIDACLDIDDGKWQQALKKLDDLTSSFPALLSQPDEQDTARDIQRKRGIVLYELHRPAEARPLLESAATQEDEKPTVLYYLGRSRCDLGDLEGAKQAFREALAGDLHHVYQPSAHYTLGLIHYWQGQHAWAIREYEWCLEHDTRSLVQKEKVLTGLVLASKALGMEEETERYSRMLHGGSTDSKAG